MPMRYLLGLYFVLLMASSAARAQEVVLSLGQTVARAQTESPAAQIARLDFASERWSFQAFRSTYRPSLQLFGNAPGLSRSIVDLQQDDGSVRYVSESRWFSFVNLSATQLIPFTGGTVSVASRLSRIDNQFAGGGFSQWQTTPVVIQYNQPILQYNPMKWAQRLEPLRFEVAERGFAEDVAAAAVEATRLFFDVYIAQINVDRAAFNVAVNDTIYTLSQSRYELGSIAENDLLQSELELLNAETDLAEARIELDRSLQDLKIAMGLPLGASVELAPPEGPPLIDVDPALAAELAERHRAAYLALQLGELEAERAVAQERRQNGLSADLTASYGLNQSGDVLDDAYTNPLDQQQLSVGFRVPLYQWGRRRAEYEAALAALSETEERHELQRKELAQEVYFETLRYRQLQAQVQLAARADTIAARRFEVARNRYTIGRIDITDLFDAQQAKDAASRAYVQTLQQAWVSYYQLRRLTLYDFEQGVPLTEGLRR